MVSNIHKYVAQEQCFRCHVQGLKKPQGKKPSEHNWPFKTTDILSYFDVLELDSNFNLAHYNRNKLYQGEKLARQYFCFNCHGMFGQGGVENQGALKNYIPGWYGTDFKHLTNDGELNAIEEWIRFGMYKAIIEKPISGNIAQYYFQRQKVKMFKLDSISDQEIDLLVNYVAYVHQLGELNAARIKQYEQQVRNTLDKNAPILIDSDHLHH